MSLVLTVHALRAWAEALPEGTIVGRRRNCEECPVAQYVKAQGLEHVFVTNLSVFHTRDDQRLAWSINPAIAATIKLTDERPDVPIGHPDGGYEVSREYFLTVLTHIQRLTKFSDYAHLREDNDGQPQS